MCIHVSQRLAITILYQSIVGLHQLDSDSGVWVVAVAKATKPFCAGYITTIAGYITGGVVRNVKFSSLFV